VRARAPDDRAAADAVRAPRRERPADLLLDGQEDAGCEHEDEHPERVQRAVVGLAQAPEREDLEQVRRDARDRQTHADDDRALWQRECGDQLLGALARGGRRVRCGGRGVGGHGVKGVREGRA